MHRDVLPTELTAAQQYILAQSKQLTDQSKHLGEQSECIKDLRHQVSYLKEQLVLANIWRFARSSERYVDPDDPQGRLFDEVALPEQETPEETPESQRVAEHKRAPGGKRTVLPSCLERVRVEHTLPDSALLGPDGEQYTKCSEVISEQLEVIPQQVRVIEHVRYQYAVKGREELGVKIALMPKQPIPKGYMWIYRNPFGAVFDYCSSRSGKHVQDTLDDYQGYVQTDRYAGYNALFTSGSGRISAACMAHARRKFMDVIKASKKNKRGVAQQAIKQIKLLYDIERVAQEKLL